MPRAAIGQTTTKNARPNVVFTPMGCTSSSQADEPQIRAVYAPRRERKRVPKYNPGGSVSYRTTTDTSSIQTLGSSARNEVAYLDQLRGCDGRSDGCREDEPSPIVQSIKNAKNRAAAWLLHDINGDPDQFRDIVEAAAKREQQHDMTPKRVAAIERWCAGVEPPDVLDEMTPHPFVFCDSGTVVEDMCELIADMDARSEAGGCYSCFDLAEASAPDGDSLPVAPPLACDDTTKLPIFDLALMPNEVPLQE